jgi:pimeloyl-ACP methyl ester carboxylesterase
MTLFPIVDATTRSLRHETFYLSCGSKTATPIIFVHGWPELSFSWRNQLPVFAGLGFHAIAPDMRGYGRSSVPTHHADYAVEHIVTDMIELLDHLGADKAVWVGHDWGAQIVWSIAQHHADRCHGVANLCVPYQPKAFGPETVIPLCNRSIYPEDRYPAAQWDYQLYYRESFAAAQSAFEANVRNTVRALFRGGNPQYRGKPSITATIRADGGWFGGKGMAPEVPRDERVLSELEENTYVAALERNGFFGPDSWYMNTPANAAFSARAPHGPRLGMPVLFVHATYDYVCETLDSRLADPMRGACDELTEAIVESGHWMAQERPVDVNARLTRWMVEKLPWLWPKFR